MEEQTHWSDDEVKFTPRATQQELQDGYLKSDGSPVRKCDGCRTWQLVEDFPTKKQHFAIWFCYTCHDMPKPVKKSKKRGERGGRYNEYVQECQRLKGEMDRITSDYLLAKTKVQDEKRQLEKEYREWLQNH